MDREHGPEAIVYVVHHSVLPLKSLVYIIEEVALSLVVNK